VRLEGLGQLKKIHLIGIRTRDLPACSIVPQILTTYLYKSTTWSTNLKKKDLVITSIITLSSPGILLLSLSISQYMAAKTFKKKYH
jgi:hypothetical protein